MSSYNRALVLTGGGARGAYQAGVLKYIGENVPEAHFETLVGSSSGAINVAGLASAGGLLAKGGPEIAGLWCQLEMNEVFRTGCPDRYAAQMAVVNQTDPYWIIRGTAFTTVTVNRNLRTTAHRDKGDLAEGFGVMSVLQRGIYDGGYLCFPKYGVAVDMRPGDVLLADVHEMHGNTEIVGAEGEYDRVSTVMYYRKRMRECLAPHEEYARRKS